MRMRKRIYAKIMRHLERSTGFWDFRTLYMTYPRQAEILHGILIAEGIVSALGESFRAPAGGRIDHYLQTHAAMYPGFSEGPLVDAAGKFRGLNTTALRRGATVTTTATTLRRVVEALLAHGWVQRGYLGVAVQPARLPEALAGQTDQETGLLVVSVCRIRQSRREWWPAPGRHPPFLGRPPTALPGRPGAPAWWRAHRHLRANPSGAWGSGSGD
jgi:hypothetical protein